MPETFQPDLSGEQSREAEAAAGGMEPRAVAVVLDVPDDELDLSAGDVDVEDDDDATIEDDDALAPGADV